MGYPSVDNMLNRLLITDFAIIDRLDFEPDDAQTGSLHGPVVVFKGVEDEAVV